jgi:hypothetical protein
MHTSGSLEINSSDPSKVVLPTFGLLSFEREKGTGVLPYLVCTAGISPLSAYGDICHGLPTSIMQPLSSLLRSKDSVCLSELFVGGDRVVDEVVGGSLTPQSLHGSEKVAKVF